MIEFNMQDKVVLPDTSTKKKLQIVNGVLSLINYDGSITPVGGSKTINTTIENKLDLNSTLIKLFDDRFNSLLPLIDSKATKEELVLSFQSLQDEFKNDLNVLKEYIDLSFSETKSNLNEKIDNNDSSIQNDLAELYNLNTSLSDDLTVLINSVASNNSSNYEDLKVLINSEVIKLIDSLTSFKTYAEETYAKKTDLPFVPNLIAGKNIRIESDNSGDLTISAIVPTFVGGGGGISKTTVQEMIDASSSGGNFVSKSGDTMTGQLVMSGAGIQLDSNLTNPAYQEGKIFYDNAEKTLAYYNDSTNVTVNVGQELLIKIKNDDPSTLVDGDVVYIYGANGNNLLARKANSNSASTSRATIGVMTETVAHNGFGYCTRLGKVHGLNTNSYNEGDTVYLSDTVSGTFTTTIPAAPSRTVRIGYICKKSAGDGHLQVDISDGLSSGELNDVSTEGISGSDVLVYSSTNSRFEPKPIINGVNKSLTYDISSGKLSALTSSLGNKTFTYNIDGQLTSISGSGLFKNKTFVYSSGKLIDIIVS